MRFVHLTAPGRLELNYMWLPTWLGINAMALKAINEALESRVKSAAIEATEEALDNLNDLVIDVLVEKYGSIHAGLRDYLDGIKFVTMT